MNWSGIILGASAFLIIGLFHPIVIKVEYHWGKGSWWLFAVAGLGFCAASLLTGGVLSAILGVVGFSCFWSILELFAQEKRVAKGWFPSNPKKRLGTGVRSALEDKNREGERSDGDRK